MMEFSAFILRSEIRQRPLLNLLGEGIVTRHHGVIRNIQGKNPLDQGFIPISAIAKNDHDVIRNTDIGGYLAKVKGMSKSIAEQQSKSIFTSLDEIFDHPDSPAITINRNDGEQINNDQSSS